MAESSGHWGELTTLSNGYEVTLPLKISKSKFHSLLIRFIMTTDCKYMTFSMRHRNREVLINSYNILLTKNIWHI